MLLLSAIALVATAAPIQLQGKCRIIAAVTVNSEPRQCCNSCSDGFLLATTWIVDTIDAEEVNEQLVHADQVQLDGSGTQTELEVTGKQQNSIHLTKTVQSPCGYCLSPEECFDKNGFVNTWHRLCTLPNLYVD